MSRLGVMRRRNVPSGRGCPFRGVFPTLEDHGGLFFTRLQAWGRCSRRRPPTHAPLPNGGCARRARARFGPGQAGPCRARRVACGACLCRVPQKGGKTAKMGGIGCGEEGGLVSGVLCARRRPRSCWPTALVRRCCLVASVRSMIICADRRPIFDTRARPDGYGAYQASSGAFSHCSLKGPAPSTEPSGC